MLMKVQRLDLRIVLLTQNSRNRMRQCNPTKPIRSPQEVTIVVAFLLSEENDSINSQNIAIGEGESTIYRNS